MGLKNAHIDPKMSKTPILGQKPKVYLVTPKLATKDNFYQRLRIHN